MTNTRMTNTPMSKLLFSLAKNVRWITNNFNREALVPISLLVELIEKLQKCLEFIKATRVNLMNYLSNSPGRESLSKTTKDGIPLILGGLIPLIRKKPHQTLPIIITILYSVRSLSLGKKPNLDSITQP